MNYTSAVFSQSSHRHCWAVEDSLNVLRNWTRPERHNTNGLYACCIAERDHSRTAGTSRIGLINGTVENVNIPEILARTLSWCVHPHSIVQTVYVEPEQKKATTLVNNCNPEVHRACTE